MRGVPCRSVLAAVTGTLSSGCAPHAHKTSEASVHAAEVAGVRSAVLHGGDVGVGLQSEPRSRGGRNDVTPEAALAQVRAVLTRRSRDDPDPWVRHVAGELEHLLDIPPSGR